MEPKISSPYSQVPAQINHLPSDIETKRPEAQVIWEIYLLVLQ